MDSGGDVFICEALQLAGVWHCGRCQSRTLTRPTCKSAAAAAVTPAAMRAAAIAEADRIDTSVAAAVKVAQQILREPDPPAGLTAEPHTGLLRRAAELRAVARLIDCVLADPVIVERLKGVRR